MSFKDNSRDVRRGMLRDNLWIRPIASYYSSGQIVQWLSCINYEMTFTEGEISSGLFPVNLHTLSILVRLHLMAFPCENTAMHYTPDHCMDVTPEGAFRRLVQEHKGSYCFGQNTLLLGMLRGIGFRAYSSSGRVNKSPPNSDIINYTAIVHMVILVQPVADSNETYLVDVGFGGTSLSQPILLSNADTNVVRGAVPPDRHRLTRGAHPSSCLESFKLSNVSPSVDWQLEFTRDIENPTWSILYAFSEEELFLSDHVAASFSVATAPWETVFWSDVIAVKYYLLSEQESNAVENIHIMKGFGEAVGTDTKIDRPKGTWMGQYIMAKGRVKRQVGTQSETILELKDETQRIRALREIFGIDIDASAVKYIEGRAAALPQNIQS